MNRKLIAAIGGLANSATMLVGYLCHMPAEFYPLAAALTGAALAVWRAAMPANAPAVLLALGIMLASGCTTAYRGKAAGVLVRPNGPAGLSATLSVDGSDVCSVRAPNGRMRVTADVAKRICAAYPRVCQWRD